MLTRETFLRRSGAAIGAAVFAPLFPPPRLGLDANALRLVPPTIAGTPTVGHVLRCTPGVWSNEPRRQVSAGYRWQRDNAGGGIYSDIGGASSNTYRLVGEDNGCNIRCNVIQNKSEGSPPVASDTVSCASRVRVTWDPTVRQKWEPDTVFLFDPDQEATFWANPAHGFADTDGTYVSYAACNPWRVGSPFPIVRGRFRRGIRGADGKSMWVAGALVPSRHFTIEFFVRCDDPWSAHLWDELLDCAHNSNEGPVQMAFLVTHPGLLQVRIAVPGQPAFALTASGIPAAGEWVGVQLTYDGSTVTLWKNGVSVASHALSPPFAWYSEDLKGRGGLVVCPQTAWTFSDLRISRVCRTPGKPVTVAAASTVTLSARSAGTVNPRLRGGVHTFGVDAAKVAVGDTFGVHIARIGKLESALPVVAGVPDANHPVAGHSGAYAYNTGPLDRLCAYFLDRGWEMYLNFGSCPQILGGSVAPLSHAQCADPTVVGTEQTYWASDVPDNVAAHATICADLYHYITTTHPALRVPYVSVANEPNLGGDVFWSGTPTQMFDLYHAIVDAIRALNPSQKVGGLDMTDYAYDRETWVVPFIDYCAASHVPLDFFSWHNYGGDIMYAAHVVEDISALAQAAGIPAPSTLIGEWGWNGGNMHRNAHPYGDFNYWVNDWGASYLVAFLLACQAAGVEAACFYSLVPVSASAAGENSVGLIDADTPRPWANGNAMRALSFCGGHVLAQTASDLENGVFVQASQNGRKVSVLVSNLKMRNDRVTDLTITLPRSVRRSILDYYVIDAAHSDAYNRSRDDATLQSVPSPKVVDGKVTLSLRPRSVHLLELTRGHGHATAKGR